MMGGALLLASVKKTRILPGVRTAAKISKRLFGNEGAECTRWKQEPRLIVVQGAAWC